MSFIEVQEPPKKRATLNASVTEENKDLLPGYAEFRGVVDANGEPEPARTLDLILTKVFDDAEFRRWLVDHPVGVVKGSRVKKGPKVGKPNGSDAERMMERSHAI